MISGRMVRIIRYLEGKEETSFRQISEELDISERRIRYDIDNINDHLKLKKMELILKKSKGRLAIPITLRYVHLQENESYFFTQPERIHILTFFIFFNIARLNLEKLSHFFMVSRTTLKNDLSVIEADLGHRGFTLEYQRGFHIVGNELNILNERVRLFREYIDFFESEHEQPDQFRDYILTEIQHALKNINVHHIKVWTENVLKQLGWVLNDDSYYWYLANVLIFTWYIKNKVDNPLTTANAVFSVFDQKVTAELEEIMNYRLNDREMNVLVSFVFFTSKYASLNEELDLLTTEKTVNELIQQMTLRLNIPFDQDSILYKGLLNHVAPLLQRIRSDVHIYDDILNVIPSEFEYIREEVRISIQHIDLLNQIDHESEIILFAIHFLASMQRTKIVQCTRVLLVCGLGYGAITMIKDKLNSIYQIHYVDTIPMYMLKEFCQWDQVDLIITTSKIKFHLSKPIVDIYPVLEEADFIRLENAGLQKKNILTNYFSINKRLDFLDQWTKQKVMDVIKEELGYSEVRIPDRKLSLSDLIGIDAIQIVNDVNDWKDAVRQGGAILSNHGFIDQEYTENIINSQEKLGFYSVKDQEFALLHGNNSSLVHISSVSLLICKQPIIFGDKRTQIVFVLASKDKKEQIPAVISLTKMTYHTDFIAQLEQVNDAIEADQIIRAYEQKVKSY